MPKKIVVLPDAGPENPFQYELVRYLRGYGHEVHIGRKYPLGSTFRAVQQHQPDVLYYDWVHSFILGKSWGWSLMKSLVFMLEISYLRNIKNIRIVHTLHNLQNHAGLWLGLERIFYAFFLRHCHQIRVYSDVTRQAAIQKFGLNPQKIAVIQDLPYHFYYQNTTTRAESRNKLNLQETDFVYLFFGEIKPYKGLDNLLAAYAQVATPHDRLLIAGKSYDASYFARLKNRGDQIPSVHWYHRFIEDQEVQYFFNAADVVVLPFVRIDHSGSVDLAMSFAKPVVTLKTESMSHLLEHQLELLFENPEALAACLQKAKDINATIVGEQNFIAADSTNYRDILTVF
jgi:glycosyltransferase involved in cell wall biosynthesis